MWTYRVGERSQICTEGNIDKYIHIRTVHICMYTYIHIYPHIYAYSVRYCIPEVLGNKTYPCWIKWGH